MKVGTDSVLLGCWAGGNRHFTYILDVGAGTGILSLLMAQRMPVASVIALEIDKETSSQAINNANSSSWGDRIQVICEDFCSYKAAADFDLIISNPPFFQNALLPDDPKCRKARHTLSLSYTDLIRKSAGLLSGNGVLALILPAEYAAEVRQIAYDHRLFTCRLAIVKTKFGGRAKRIMMEFSRTLQLCRTEEITIHQSDGAYSECFRKLTKAVYPEDHRGR